MIIQDLTSCYSANVYRITVDLSEILCRCFGNTGTAPSLAVELSRHQQLYAHKFKCTIYSCNDLTPYVIKFVQCFDTILFLLDYLHFKSIYIVQKNNPILVQIFTGSVSKALPPSPSRLYHITTKDSSSQQIFTWL